MGVAVGDAVGVAVGDAVGVAVGDAVGVGVGAGFAIATPLFQINFLPDFMQVYFLPAYTEVDPAFEQLAPAFGTAA